MRQALIVNAIRKRKNDTLLEFGDGSVLLVDPELVRRMGLEADSGFDLKELLRENEEFSRRRAAEYALDYLEKSPRSVKQVTDHLFSKNLQASAVRQTVEKLTGAGLLNDRDLARNTAESMASSGRSLRKIREKLLRKGIDDDTIRENTSFLDSGTEEANLREFLRKKNESLKRYPPAVRREKLARSAVSAGFSSSDALRAAGELTGRDDPEDYGDYYRDTGEKRLRELLAKGLSEKELRRRFASDMRKKGSPPRFIDECLRHIEEEEK